MVRFEHTEHLLLLLLIPLFLLLFRSVLVWKKNTVKKIGDEILVKQLILNFSYRNYIIKFVVVLLSLTCLIIAAANWQSAAQAEKISRQGTDVIIALDVSRSMFATDSKPSRMERSKQFIIRLMNRLGNNRVGLVLFAGRAYMQMPLTSDYTAAGMYVSNAGPDAVPTQGTVIADALKVSNSGFNAKDKKYKTVILITDGEDHDDQAIKTARQLAEYGVVIHTIGVGSVSGSPVLNPATGERILDVQGNVIVSRLNEQELMDIAHAANGTYHQLNDIETVMDSITAELAGMDQKNIQDSRLISYRSFFQWFLVLAFVGLSVELFISEKIKI